MASVMACSPMSSIIFLMRIERQATSRSVLWISVILRKALRHETAVLAEKVARWMRLTDGYLNVVIAHKLESLSLRHGDRRVSERKLESFGVVCRVRYGSTLMFKLADE